MIRFQEQGERPCPTQRKIHLPDARPLPPAQRGRGRSTFSRRGAPPAGAPKQDSGGTLPAGMVDGVVCAAGAGEDELGDGHKGVALLEQGLQNGGQSLGGVEGGIVEEHDGSRLNLAGDPLDNLRGGQILPVQAVTVPNRFKPPGGRGRRVNAANRRLAWGGFLRPALRCVLPALRSRHPDSAWPRPGGDMQCSPLNAYGPAPVFGAGP